MSTQQILLASAGPFLATGGTITEDGTYRYHEFNEGAVSNFVVTQGYSDEVDFELIGGGATGKGNTSGSGGIGGGGGAGDLVERFAQVFAVGTYPVSIANTVIGPATGSTQGEDSTFNGVTAIGGGREGVDGASGGGAVATGGSVAGGDALGENGNDGGNSSGFTAGGGGGAGGNGGTPTAGAGVVSNFDGTTVCQGGRGAQEGNSGGTNQGNGNAPGDGGGGSRNNGGNGTKGGNGFGGRLIVRYPLSITM